MRLGERFSEALRYAVELHAGQRRKGSLTPYIAHLLAVCSLVLEHGADEDEAIAALLHDAIEDQGGAPTRQEIRRRFGDRVTAIVDGCTDTDKQPKTPWRQRKESYLAHLSSASSSVRLVSTADKLHNARSILRDYQTHGEALFGRFRGGREGTLWYYRTFVEIISRTGPHSLAAELGPVVAELEARSDGPAESHEP